MSPPSGEVTVVGSIGEALRRRAARRQTSHAMMATTSAGKPTIKASCSARHAMSRLPTEPSTITSASVSTKLLRRERHCHPHTTRPNKNAATCHAICTVWKVCSDMTLARMASGSSRTFRTFVNRTDLPSRGSSMRMLRMPRAPGATAGCNCAPMTAAVCCRCTTSWGDRTKPRCARSANFVAVICWTLPSANSTEHEPLKIGE